MRIIKGIRSFACGTWDFICICATMNPLSMFLVDPAITIGWEKISAAFRRPKEV